MRTFLTLCGAATLTAASLTGCIAASEAQDDTSDLAADTPHRAEQPAACPAAGPALQVLGSGGPIAEAADGIGRAGTSYLLWIDGEPRLLIDAGEGSFLRFAQAGGKVASLDAILLTHLHADHAGDLSGILNTGGFEGRTEPLPIIGPDGGERIPATSEFLRRLIGKEAGAFSYNGGYLNGSEGKVLLEPRDIVTGGGAAAPSGLDISNDYSVMALPVDHSFAPALGYEIEIGGKSVVITGDQNAFSAGFENALAGSKPAVLFAHHVIHGGSGQPRGLHRTPGQIGELAAGLEPDRVVLTHNMQRSLSRLDEGLAAIAESYSGPVSVARDLDCYPLD